MTFEDIKNIVNSDNNRNLIAIQSKNELNIDYISPTHAEYIFNKSKNEINNLIFFFVIYHWADILNES